MNMWLPACLEMPSLWNGSVVRSREQGLAPKQAGTILAPVLTDLSASAAADRAYASAKDGATLSGNFQSCSAPGVSADQLAMLVLSA